MEPNPIFIMEQRQARRCGFFWLTLLVGMIMGVFLLWLACQPSYRSPYFHLNLLSVPVIYYIALGLLVPFYVGSRFSQQQLAEDPRLNTPLTTEEILRGKHLLALFLYLPLYLPTLPGQLFLLLGGYSEYFFISTLILSLSVVLSYATVGLLAGLRSIAGLMARVVVLLLHSLGAYFLFWLCFGLTMYFFGEFLAFRSPGNIIAIVAVLLLFLEVATAALAVRYGQVLFRPHPDKEAFSGFLVITGVLLFFAFFLLYSAILGGVLGGNGLVFFLLLVAIFITLGLYLGPVLILIAAAAPTRRPPMSRFFGD